MRRQATSAFLLVWCFAFSLPPTTKSWAFTIQSTKALSPNPIPYRNAYNHAIRKNRFSAAGVRPTAIFSQSSGGLQPSNQVVDREESSTKSEELLPPPSLENHEATYVPTKLLDSSVDEIGLIDEPDPASNADLMDPEWKDLKKKLFNGTLLAVSFGFVIFTVLNIDHGMTRGWTQSVSGRHFIFVSLVQQVKAEADCFVYYSRKSPCVSLSTTGPTTNRAWKKNLSSQKRLLMLSYTCSVTGCPRHFFKRRMFSTLMPHEHSGTALSVSASDRSYMNTTNSVITFFPSRVVSGTVWKRSLWIKPFI
jgi:hypothetical protein